MLVLTQLVFVKPGKEPAFLEFEERVLPLLERHGGELVLRVRPNPLAIVSSSVGNPYEIHIVRFTDEGGLAKYMNAPERTQWLVLKDESLQTALVFKGAELKASELPDK